MKYVILLFLISTTGCFLCTPNALDLKIPEPEEVGEPDFFIELKDDLFFYKNEKIEREGIKTLIQKMKADIAGKRHVVMGIRSSKSARVENVLFLMDLGMSMRLKVKLDSKE